MYSRGAGRSLPVLRSLTNVSMSLSTLQSSRTLRTFSYDWRGGEGKRGEGKIGERERGKRGERERDRGERKRDCSRGVVEGEMEGKEGKPL